MKFIKWLDKILKSDTKESSKRVSAIFALIVAAIISFIFTRPENVSFVLGLWLGFSAAALSITYLEKKK